MFGPKTSAPASSKPITKSTLLGDVGVATLLGSFLARIGEEHLFAGQIIWSVFAAVDAMATTAALTRLLSRD